MPNVSFNTDILKTDHEYSEENYQLIKQLYEDYLSKVQLIIRKSGGMYGNEDETLSQISRLKREFKTECFKLCLNEHELANIVIDVCYKTDKDKSFAWDIAGEIIFNNILSKSNNKMMIPVLCDAGNITFNGSKFCLEEITYNTREDVVHDNI